MTTTRILVIEDDPTVAEVVARYLTREGYQVDVVSDGAEGLRRALADLPDLVVLDLMLPGLSGLEVCRRLRQPAPVPVIMLTARRVRWTGSPVWRSGPTTMWPSRSRRGS